MTNTPEQTTPTSNWENDALAFPAADVNNGGSAQAGAVATTALFKQGDQGELVREFQQALLDNGITSIGEVDGVYGRKTAAAIQEYQALAGLPRTGILDSATYERLVFGEPIKPVDTNAVDQTTQEAATPVSDSPVDVALKENESNTSLSQQSIEQQVQDLVGTNVRAAAILGAFSKESGGDFSKLTENSGYRLATANKLFSSGKVQRALASLSPEERQRVNNGEASNAFGLALFDQAYSGGREYRGRGLIHITHDYNYKAVGDRIGVDLVSNPELINDPRYAVPAALAFLELNGFFKEDTTINKNSLHNIVNPGAGNDIKNARWASAQAYLSGWQAEAAPTTSPTPTPRQDNLGQ